MSLNDKIINKKDLKSLSANFLSLTSIKLFSFVLPLITFPYLIRVLGVEKFGLIMFAQATMYYFEIIVDFGFNLSATREIALNSKNSNKLNEIISAVLSIKFFLVIFCCLMLSLVVNAFERFTQDSILYYYSFLKVVALAFFPVWYFQGIEKMKYITIINIISKSIFTILIFIFIKTEADYLLVPLISGFGYIIGSLIAIAYLFIKFKRTFILCSFAIIRSSFYESSMFFLSRVSVSLYTSSNAFFLGLVTSNVMVGYYAVAEKLYMVIRQMYQPVVQVVYPYMSKSRNVRFFTKVYPIVIFINCIGVYILWILTPDIISLVAQQNFDESVQVFRIFLIVACIVAPSILIGYPFLAALGFKNEANYSTIIGSLFHVIVLFSLYFINWINIYNIVYLLIITEVIVLLYRWHIVHKNKLFSV